MKPIDPAEYERLPLRVHALLAGVPLHDVWAIDLGRARAHMTLDDFYNAAGARLFAPSPAVGALLALRFWIGRIFGWDREHPKTVRPTFADRLTDADRAASLAPPGKPQGLFRTVYRFQNEQLLEVINQTAQAAALSALVETATGYRFYFAVYVRNVSRLTPVYMALIDPFRKLIVYPSILRSVRANWELVTG